MKKQILLIVMTLCAISAMGVNLPTASYKSFSANLPSQDTYSLSIGTTFVNHSTVGAYNGSCQPNNADNFGSDCYSCCIAEICPSNEDDCIDESNPKSSLFLTCMEVCSGEYLGQSPLDAPVVFLLALIAAYGAVAVYRRKMQQV